MRFEIRNFEYSGDDVVERFGIKWCIRAYVDFMDDKNLKVFLHAVHNHRDL